MKFSQVSLLLAGLLTSSLLQAAPDGVQNVGTFTDLGSTVSNDTYLITSSGSGIDLDPIDGAYLLGVGTGPSAGIHTFTVSLTEAASIISFELTGILFTEYSTVIGAEYRVWIIGNLAGGGTVGGSFNAVTGSSAADNYSGALTASFSGVQLSSFAVHFEAITGNNIADLAFTSFTTVGTPIPEPATWAALIGVACLGFAGWRRRCRAS